MKKEMSKETVVCITLTRENFSQEVLANTQPVLVEFGAEWCGTCHILAPVLKELTANFKEQLKVCHVDVDRDTQLSEIFGIVRRLPAFLFFQDGQVVDSIVGMVPKEIMIAKLHKILSNSELLEQ